MRRLIGGALLAALVVGAVLLARAGSPSSPYRVDAIFDNARGLVAGQVVKVAGARVGRIEGVRLTPRFQARISMVIDRRFAPFRGDAACAIRPEGLIAENYIECDPGTLAQAPLTARGVDPPTVALAHNSAPVTLTDFFNIFDTPTRDRLRVIINELGIATAGRGDDLNAIIRRAAPALALTHRALGILNRQHAQIAAAITNSDRLIGHLAHPSDRVPTFLVRAAAVADRIGHHRDALSQAVARLPPLLRQGRTDLRSLDAVTAAGTPLLRGLMAAAPDLNRVSTELPSLARAAGPAGRRLGAALATGTTTARRLAPVVRTVRNYAQTSLPGALLSGRLYTNLRDRGFVESLLALFYYGAAASARFDSVSHLLPAHALLNNCPNYATTPTPGCAATYPNPGGRQAVRRTPSSRTSPGPALAPALRYLLGR